MAAADNANSSGAKVIANLAPYQSIQKNVFEKIDYLILNETEATQLSKDLDLANDAVETIAEHTACAVVKTLGARGIEAVDEQSKKFTLPGIKVESIDTVGAGDTFAGFLGAMLAKDNSLQNACKVANAAAAVACTKKGAQTAIPTMQDVVDLANQKR